MILSDKIKSNKNVFIAKVQAVADALGVPSDWLMIVMYFESRLNEKAQNKNTLATGLIQFMPSTAKALGTTTDELLNISNVEQMDYVYKYLYPHKNKIASLTDLYLCVFYPSAVGKPNTYELGTTDANKTLIANYNPIFDTDKNGVITKGEIEQYIRKFALNLGYDEVNKKYTTPLKKKF